jgi:omega-6 fatty acid desaturase (delta-12 desaturase)
MYNYPTKGGRGASSLILVIRSGIHFPEDVDYKEGFIKDRARRMKDMMDRIEKAWFRDKGSLPPTILALLYCHLAYFGGMGLILSLESVAMAIGTLVMAHGMVIAAYIIHDCGHNSVFRSSTRNAFLGKFLNWFTGGCYGSYEDLRANHMRHHVDNADVVILDYRGYLARRPVERKIVEVLEWLYVPATEFLMHAALVLAPFIFEEKREQQLRVIGVILVRFSLLAAVFAYSPLAYLCYLLAYWIFLTVLRFMDALQHNYGIVLASDNRSDRSRLLKHRGDRQYEQSHTFSNVISTRYPWLNLVTLNFGYHNAHHARPTAPWHQLPKLHESLYGRGAGGEKNFIIPFAKLLSSFHSGRVARVFGDSMETEGNGFIENLHDGRAVGASGISFLTPL